uniref:Uncharacterized protein n=1 Tax=Ciona savignyi TaxID=51511 RepID=H2ZCE1_CIOSA
MFDQSSPWLSFGFKDNKPALFKYKNFSLDHQHTQQKNHKTMGQTLIAPNPRREKQRHRVNEAMHKRMLERRARIQRDLLQGFSPEYIDSIIGQEPTHNYYHHYVNNQGEDIGSISDLGSFSTQSEKTVQRKFLTTRTRPKSASFVRRNPLIKKEMLDAAILPTSYADETNIIVGDRRRPASAQVTRKTRAGCEYCPVDCRPLSSSSHKPTSSTGLQATNGPAHFHYFHYNRYMRFQRPKSAIATRREYLESTNRHKPEESPRFTNIVKSCTVHKKEASLEQKPQSPRTKVKVAWVEDEPMILDNSNVVITPPEPTDKTIEQSDGFVQAADQSTQVVADDEDSELNAGVRFQAEVTYQQATDDHIDTFEEELDFDARKDILGLPRAPTPTPVSSRAQSPEAKQEGEQELPKPPVIYQSTDILTGRSNSVHEVDMEVAGEDVDF